MPKKPGKRQRPRSASKESFRSPQAVEAKPQEDAKRHRPSGWKELSSLRHIRLRVEDAAPSGTFVDALVFRTGQKPLTCLIVFDSAADTGDILAAVSQAGEIASSAPVVLPAELAGKPAARGSSASSWSAIRVSFDSKRAWKQLRGLDTAAPQEDDDGKPVGMAKWVAEAEALLPRSGAAAEAADKAMAAFEAAEEDVERRRRALMGKPDEDGFVTVVPKARGKSNSQKAAAAASAGPDAWGYMTTNRKRKSKKAAMEDQDFYAFQKRERKISELEAIRRKYEADKERIRKQREQRTFKPV